MKYVVDRIVNNIVVLQNLDNKIMFEVEESELDFKVKDGDILVFSDGKYIKDDKAKQDRINLIKEKMNKAKNIDASL